ncbi:hypothetical protein RJ53_04695 [Methanocalculus chunghsingensis]|uniref:Uncharacterized protein n=1 Tax=Methanocalculus chunghsingensis TaxID=156457 RepID=A0A8J8B4K9_9EURY|nr:cohesin domain-containing protein [Methanocalculus chunghsingensis]MBR1368846.1 hypothetical protein [Methanocalculus chunghsingensis]
MAACTGLAAAQEIAAGTVTDVQKDTTASVGIYGQNMASLDAFTIVITYDPTVMTVPSANATYNPAGWSIFPNVAVPGTVTVSAFANSPADSLSGTTSLFGLNCRAEKDDGSSTPLTVSITTLSDPGTVGPYTPVDGSFTTKDDVPPEITITTPADGATVPQDVAVTATITDVGGVDPATITVSVGGVAIPNSDLTITPVAGGYTVTGTRSNVPLGASTVVVAASDMAGNLATRTHTITVAESGITFNPNLDGTFTNATEPVIKADYVQVTGATVKMFINNVDVTGQITLTPSSADAGSIELNYTAYGALADGQYTIVVNGTSSLFGVGEVSRTQSFTKDTIAPVVTINGITDSDGDGYPEALETLTIAYTVTDANPQSIWIGGASSTTFPSGNLAYGVAQGNTQGNRQAVVYAVDEAGNVGQSAPFHIYNNYLAYIDEPTAGEFAGLDLTKTAVYNYFTPSVARAFTIGGAAGTMNLPTLGVLQKQMTAGSGVVVDNRANDDIAANTIPQGVSYYIDPTGTLTFTASVPNIDKAAILIGKANSTLIDEILRSGSASASKDTIEAMLSKDKVVMYGPQGYAIFRIDDNGDAIIIKTQAPFDFYTDLPTMIKENYVNLHSGYTAPSGLQVSDLGPGEYSIVAMCLDGPDERISLISATPFIITEEASQFTTTADSYLIGNPVVVNWGGAAVPQNIAGLLIREGSTYTGNVTIDLTTLGTGSLDSVYLIGDGNQSVKKLISQANVWISEGYGNAATTTNSKTLDVDTTGLLTGTYTVHMIVENNGYLTSYGTKQVTLTTVTPTPTPTPAPGPSGGGGSSAPRPVETVGTGSLLTNSLGQLLQSYIVDSSSKAAKVYLNRNVVALDRNGAPLSEVTIDDLAAGDVPAVPSGAAFSFAGHAVTLGPAGATFSPSIRLAFELTEAQWNAAMAEADQNPDFLVVKWYNAEAGVWENVPTTVNPETRTITASITHFSIFALFADTEAPSVIVTPTPTPVVTPDVPTTPDVPVAPEPSEFPWTYVIIGIVLLLLIAGGAYYYNKNN